jgi:hypothetical protein
VAQAVKYLSSKPEALNSKTSTKKRKKKKNPKNIGKDVKEKGTLGALLVGM